MNPTWQISVGDVSEALRPLAFVLAALASACVLADARRARLSAAASAAWTLLALASPPVVLPLYLAARLFTPRRDAAQGATPTPVEETSAVGDADEEATNESLPVKEATDESIAGKDETIAGKDETDESRAAGGEGFRQQCLHQRLWPRLRRGLRRAAVPALYASALLAFGGLYFYRDAQSADARLLRANRAKLYGQHGRAVAEYRAALASDDDAHTRKLLALELAGAGRWDEALAEFQAAARADGDDDTLAFHTARALEATGRGADAADEYRKFLQSRTCAQTPPARLCEAARSRLAALGDAAARR